MESRWASRSLTGVERSLNFQADGRTAATWEPAPDPKSNEISVNKLKLQRALGEESWQTLTTPDFAIEEIEAGFEMLEPGDGVKFAGENWIWCVSRTTVSDS